MSAITAFARIHALIENTIEFKDSWKNSTGYFDNAVWDETIPQGEIVKTSDEHGRKILIIGAPKGNVVIFERYFDRKNIIVSNAPTAIEHAFNLHSQLNDEKVISIFGIEGDVDYFLEMEDAQVLTTIKMFHLGNRLVELFNHFA